MKIQHKRELATLTALIQMGKALAESVRLWVTLGQVESSERQFANGQLQDFDAAWNEYSGIVQEQRKAASDRCSKQAYRRHHAELRKELAR